MPTPPAAPAGRAHREQHSSTLSHSRNLVWCFVHHAGCTKGWLVTRKPDGSCCTETSTTYAHRRAWALHPRLWCSLHGHRHITLPSTLRSRSSKQFPQNKSLFPSSKRLQGQPRSCTSTRRDRVQLHAFLFYFSILFFKFGDCCKLCLQLRLLGNTSPRTTIAVISLLLLGRLTFSFLPLIFWLEFQHKV